MGVGGGGAGRGGVGVGTWLVGGAWCVRGRASVVVVCVWCVINTCMCVVCVVIKLSNVRLDYIALWLPW